MTLTEAFFVCAICLFGLLGIFLTTGTKSWSYGFGWLGLLFLLIAINFIDGMMLLNGTLLGFPRLAFLEDPLVLLYGPLIYFFTLHLKARKWVWTSKLVFHILPFIFFELLVAIFHVVTATQDMVKILDSIRNLNQNFIVLISVLPFFIHVLTYLILARKTLVQHLDELKQYYSSIDIDWAFLVIQMVTITLLVSFLSSIVQYSGLKDIFAIFLLLLMAIAIVFILRLLLKAMSRPLFQAVVRPASGSILSISEIEEVREKIVKNLAEKKLFTNPELTVKDLAHEINVSDRTVSHVINNAIGKSFYDFVNDYRIHEACLIFDANVDPKLTVLEVLYMVGFNSKSSFNTQFKKKTGLTPSAYKARQGGN